MPSQTVFLPNADILEPITLSAVAVAEGVEVTVDYSETPVEPCYVCGLDTYGDSTRETVNVESVDHWVHNSCHDQLLIDGSDAMKDLGGYGNVLYPLPEQE